MPCPDKCGYLRTPGPEAEETNMKRVDIRGIVGVILLMAGAFALVGGVGVVNGEAADPDRYVFESDRFDDELQYRLERTLSRLEDLEVLEDMEILGDEFAVMIEEILEGVSVKIDGDWPDVIYIDPDDHDFRIDTRRLARDVERMARQIERDVVRDMERSHRDGRAWRVDRDRETIESEMRDLESELQRLQRELERLEEEGDI
jgi:hypothetical protein